MIQRTSSRVLPVLTGLLCVAQAVYWAPPLVTKARAEVVGERPRLLKHDRLRLIEAVAQNKPLVTVLIAAREGMNAAVASEARRLNGTIAYRDDDVDYVRVEIPTRNVQELALSAGIEAINLAGNIDYLSPAEDRVQAASKAVTTPMAVTTGVEPPGRDTPAVNPYLPASAIGAPEFIASHPTFDGRGVVVALVDTNIDFLVPELRTATALDGRAVPKFADIYSVAPNAVQSATDDSGVSGYLRVPMQTKLKATGGKLVYLRQTYSVPADDEYRIGLLDERISGATGDLNRDGNPPGSSGLFAVLWNDRTNKVWIDTDQDFDFTDEQALTDYRVNHESGTFGHDDPKTAIRETVGFVVQTDVRHEAVFVIPGYGGHGTGVSGAAFGAGFFGGRMNGVAPAAQLISIPTGRGPGITAHHIEAVITAMKDPRVDLVSVEFGNYLPLNDGQSTFSIVANRLVTKYGKLLFAAAGNGNDGLNGIVSPADAKEVIAVGSYLSNETSRVNYGVELPDVNNMNGYTSHGPAKDGTVKPNLLAPTTTLSTKPAFLPGENRYGTYPLPPGYQVYSGTSTSTPFAAAGAALLISAAKQSGVKYDARRLRWAMLSSARFLPRYSPELQGAGLLQIPAAWEALKHAPEPIEIVSRAPVNAVLSDYLREPNQGVGIFEREGWTAGHSGARTISFTRISGKPQPIRFQLRWTSNDGTFSGPSEITLPLNKPVDLKLSIAPKANGVHAAVLNLVSANGDVVYQVMNTIVAAEQVDARNSFSVTRHGQADWLQSQSYFVNVPAGTPAFRVDVQISEGNVMPSLTRPNGSFYYLLSPEQLAVSYTRYQNAGSWTRVVSNPDPGVWQIAVDNCNTLEHGVSHRTASFQVTAELLGVSFSEKQPDANTEAVTYSNTHANFKGGVLTTALASTFATTASLQNGEPAEYEIDVPPGAVRVGATVAPAGNPNGDLDLYLFDCTRAQCVLRDFSSGNDATEAVAVDSPAAGKWKVVIDDFSASKTSYHYKDYFLHPAFGRLVAQDGPKEVAAAAVVSEPVSLDVKAILVGLRHLEAIAFVTSAPLHEPREQKGNEQLYYTDIGVLGMTTIPLRPVTSESERN